MIYLIGYLVGVVVALILATIYLFVDLVEDNYLTIEHIVALYLLSILSWLIVILYLWMEIKATWKDLFKKDE